MASYTFNYYNEFIKANINLPNGYKKLDYIGTNGLSYIDSLIPIQSNIGYSVIYKSTKKTTYNTIIGNFVQNVFACYLIEHNNELSIYNQTNSLGTMNLGDLNCVETNYKNNSNIIVNGVKKSSIILPNRDYSYKIGGGWTSSYIKFYIVGFSQDNIITKTFVPCEYNGILGFYDISENSFYENEGSMPFIGGNESPTYSFQNGDIITITNEKNVYKYNNGELIFYYHIAEPLVFKGMTFEQTDLWQRPEFVFRGFTFEEITKAGGMSPLFLAEP